MKAVLRKPKPVIITATNENTPSADRIKMLQIEQNCISFGNSQIQFGLVIFYFVTVWFKFDQECFQIVLRYSYSCHTLTCVIWPIHITSIWTEIMVNIPHVLVTKMVEGDKYSITN